MMQHALPRLLVGLVALASGSAPAQNGLAAPAAAPPAREPGPTTAPATTSAGLRIELSPAHIAAVNRPRRIYANNDVGIGGPMGPQPNPITPEEWIAWRFSVFGQPGCHVDTIGWCLDEGNLAAYASTVLPVLQYPTLLRWLQEGHDPIRLLVDASHQRGLEAFWEYRINGADREADVSTAARLPLKEQHPEWLVPGSWWGPGMWNFAVPAVREFKLAVLREVAETRDLDGINLDFGRHPPFLPYDEQWAHRDALTDFVRQVRLMLQEVSQRRGRPFLLSVRVADTVPGCHFDGMDVETWVRQNLVDLIILGTRSIQVDLAGFRDITRGSHVKLYPCIDQGHSPEGYHAVTALEFLRGVAANWWQQGADGIAVFNFWNETPEAAAKVAAGSGPLLPDGRSVHAQAYREIGDPAALALLDKWFVVARRGGDETYTSISGPWNDYINMNRQVPLPLGLPPEPAWVEVCVADDLATREEQVAHLELRLRFGGEINPQNLGVKLNGIRLQNPATEAGWCIFPLTARQTARGRNLVTLRYPTPVSLEKLEIRVQYRTAN